MCRVVRRTSVLNFLKSAGASSRKVQKTAGRSHAARACWHACCAVLLFTLGATYRLESNRPGPKLSAKSKFGIRFFIHLHPRALWPENPTWGVIRKLRLFNIWYAKLIGTLQFFCMWVAPVKALFSIGKHRQQMLPHGVKIAENCVHACAKTRLPAACACHMPSN